MIVNFRRRAGTSSLERMTREELRQHASRGRSEDLEAARESLIRWRRRMGERSPWDPSNVVPYRPGQATRKGKV